MQYLRTWAHTATRTRAAVDDVDSLLHNTTSMHVQFVAPGAGRNQGNARASSESTTIITQLQTHARRMRRLRRLR